MRKKKADPEADFDGKSLYLCGQSDKALSRLLHETDSKYTGKNLKLIQKAESFMSFEYDQSLKNFTSRANSKVHALQGKDSKQQVPPFNPLELKLDESASKTNSVDSRDEKTELILHDSVASKEDMSKKVNFSIANRSNDAIDAKP